MASERKVRGLRERVHPKACISETAQLAADVQVGAYTIIGPDVVIHEGCTIGPHVTIAGRTEIGPRTRIYTGALIGVADPAGFRSDRGCDDGADTTTTPSTPAQARQLIIGADNIIREYAVLRPGNKITGPTQVGDGNFIMGYVYLGSGCQIGNGVIITQATHLGDGVTVEDGAVISGLSEIAAGVRIGELAMVGAVTCIRADIPPYLMVAGNPPQVHGINVVGLRRHEISPEDRADLKRAFKIIYRTNQPLATSIEELSREFPHSPLVQHLIEFLRQSRRGVFQQ
ncbi:MAG: acyl-[acyl-carrier-protein]--UDP-N-acetylglucosamine O-acyltransferase [Limnochordales bacterium]|nr:acyl-[acyl-carrier-protein]--UDP-N-acetylglucosamine O-acyltransferase [Limnochordales bacterium]